MGGRSGIRFAAVSLWCCVAWHSSAQAQEAAFDILEFEVTGNTVLADIAIERAVYRFMGPGRTVVDVNAAAEALEKVYQDAGYLSVGVTVPEQPVASGVIKLQVVEGRVERLRVSGAQYTLPSDVRMQVSSAAEGEVLQFPDLQRDLGKLSRNPDVSVTPLLRAGSVPGSLEVELKLDDRSPLHGNVELNTREGADTSVGRLEASIRYDNLWQERHSIGVNYFGSPQNRDDVEVFGANYSAPFAGGVLAGFFAKSDSSVPTVFDTVAIGRGTTSGLRWILPLPNHDQGLIHSISVGADFKDSEQDTVISGLTVSRPVKYKTLGAQYFVMLPGENGALWKLGLALTAGLRGMNEKTIDCSGFQVEQFNCRREGATPNFLVTRIDAQRTQPLWKGWKLIARTELQRASAPLINNEQFSVGGLDTVRGYLEGERAGDEGERVRAELHTAPMWRWGESGSVSMLAFWDWAAVRLKLTGQGQQRTGVLASAGLGMRLSATKGLSLDADWAFALRDGSPEANRTRRNDQRAAVRLQYEF